MKGSYEMIRSLRYCAHICFGVLCVLLATACNESLDDSISEDPYSGGKEPLGISLKQESPSPSSANPGDEVVFQATGLLNYYDAESGKADFQFYISDEEAEVVGVTESTVTVLVPLAVSTGTTYIKMQGQVFYGPRLTILGNVTVDEAYKLWETNQVNGIIYNYLESYVLANNFYLVGDFTYVGATTGGDANKRGLIALVDADGGVAARNSTRYKLSSGATSTLTGADGYSATAKLTSVSYFDNGDHTVLLSGYFSGFESLSNIYSIITLQSDLTPLKDEVSLTNRLTGATSTVQVPHFNGGPVEQVIRSYPTADNQVIAIGNFTQYCRNDYDNSYQDAIAVTYEAIGPVIRTDMAGVLDTTYRAGKSGLPSGGTIKDAARDKDGNLILVGDFASFDGISAPNIVKINAETGEVDETFLANLGTGFDGAVSTVRYNEELDKMAVVGSFSNLDGQAQSGVALLSGDGTPDTDFSTRTIEGGKVNFASLISSGMVVMSGTFTKYDGVSRPGFLILDADGAATQDFNVPGEFSGQIYQAVETLTTSGFNGLLLLGDISRFNGEEASNAVMIQIDF